MTEPKRTEFIHTLVVRNRNERRVLSKLIESISIHSGSVGEITILGTGEQFVRRAINVITPTQQEFDEIVEAIKGLKGTQLENYFNDAQMAHRGGKIKTVPKRNLENLTQMRAAYTPSAVAQICRDIFRNPDLAYLYTWKASTVLIISNGTRVLGLGPIGALPALPVLEGKSALFSIFTGYNMVPIVIPTTDPEKFVQVVKEISVGFGAIHLEDIATPACYTIEQKLREELKIPVIHVDQHATAVAALAAVLNACNIVGRDIRDIQIGQIGTGAAGSAILHLVSTFKRKSVLCFDQDDKALERAHSLGGKPTSLEKIMATGDLIICNTGVKGLIPKSLVRRGQIILALSNPHPEITRNEAISMGAILYSDGSQVNNLLAYPGLLKGALDANAMKFTHEMLFAGAEALVQKTPKGELSPDPYEPELHDVVAEKVKLAAIRGGISLNLNLT